MSNFPTSNAGYEPAGQKDQLASDQHLPDRPSRVWTVFSTLLIAILLSLVSQVAVGAVLAGMMVAQGTNPTELSDKLVPMLMSPSAFTGLLVLAQLSIFVSAMLAAKLSRVPITQRIEFVSPRCPPWMLVLFVLGSTLPMTAGVGAAHLVAKFIEPDASVQML